MGDMLGPRLRSLRLGAGMSQNQLAIRSGIPKSRLSRYENGHLLPSIPTLRRLARALAIPESALLDEASPATVFLETLESRGHRFGTAERARSLAHRVSDILDGLSRSEGAGA